MDVTIVGNFYWELLLGTIVGTVVVTFVEKLLGTFDGNLLGTFYLKTMTYGCYFPVLRISDIMSIM